MRNIEAVELLKYSLSFDACHACKASYEAGGTIRARLWPARSEKQGMGRKERLSLITREKIEIGMNDRITCTRGLFRVIEARRFPKHTEATLEKEDQPA